MKELMEKLLDLMSRIQDEEATWLKTKNEDRSERVEVLLKQILVDVRRKVEMSDAGLDAQRIKISTELESLLQSSYIEVFETLKREEEIALARPVELILSCPSCGKRHIDEGVWATRVHHTHSCQWCGVTWRPAVRATVGVKFLPGFRNEVATSDLWLPGDG